MIYKSLCNQELKVKTIQIFHSKARKKIKSQTKVCTGNDRERAIFSKANIQ